MRTFATIVVLASSILFLVISGGGLFPSTVAITALVVNLLIAILVLFPLRAPPGSVPLVRNPLLRLETVMAMLLLLVLLSALPLPPALDWLAGPLRHEQNQTVVTAFERAAQAGVPVPLNEPWFSITRNRAGTLRYFLLLAAAFGAMAATASLLAGRRIAFLHILAVLGTAVGIAGWISQWKIPQGDTIWWFIPIPHAPTSSVGCFLNRNHFGGFIAMLCPVTLALAHDAAVRKKWFVLLYTLTLTGIMAAIVALSLSRGAMLALGAGLVALSGIIAFRHSVAWGGIFLAVLLAGGMVIAGQSTVVRDRLAGIHHPASLDSVQSRLAEWRESLRVWHHYPLFGAGMNALRMVYPQYRQTSVSARLIHAENEYVQMLVEGGVVGVGLALALLAVARSRLRESPGAIPDVIKIAVAGALTVTGIHCFVDFPAHLPLYAMVLGSLAGLALPANPDPGTRKGRAVLLLPALIGMAGATVILMTHPAILKDRDDPETFFSAKYRELNQALIWAPTSSAWLYWGRALYKEGATRGEVGLCSEGVTCMTRACELDPQNYRLWYELGSTRLALKLYDGAVEAFKRANQIRPWLTPPSIPGRP